MLQHLAKRPAAHVQDRSPWPDQTLVDHALDYARRGWPVFPCDPNNKEPLVRRDRDEAGNKIPKTGGLYKATTFEAQIRSW